MSAVEVQLNGLYLMKSLFDCVAFYVKSLDQKHLAFSINNLEWPRRSLTLAVWNLSKSHSSRHMHILTMICEYMHWKASVAFNRNCLSIMKLWKWSARNDASQTYYYMLLIWSILWPYMPATQNIYMACQFMPFPMTLNDLEGHSPVAGLFKCNSTNICAAFCTVSTDTSRRTVCRRQLSLLLIVACRWLFSWKLPRTIRHHCSRPSSQK